MTTTDPQGTKVPPARPVSALDLQDERLLRQRGLRGAFAAFGRRVRAGDLGALPVVVGLIIISIIFQFLSGGTFLSAVNLVNLAAQSASVGPIAVGIVLVLLLGQIDLSVGSVSGLASAMLGVLLVNAHLPMLLVIVLALAAGAAIGALYGFLFTRFGVPSFVITLAGLLAFLGIQLIVLGPTGTINLPDDSFIVNFASFWFAPAWLSYALVGLIPIGVLVSDVLKNRRRRAVGLSTNALSFSIIKAAALLIILGVIVAYLSTNRGLGASFIFFVAIVAIMNFLLMRTTWGRSVYAIGGNVEAARRSGIPVRAVYLSVFMLCSVFAVVGGLVSAGYLSAASIDSGTGDVNLDAIAAAVIGGTSLFGGRGNMWSALLGVIVIQAIANGLDLINIDTNARFVVTGAVLLIAVLVDALSRRSRQSHGAA